MGKGQQAGKKTQNKPKPTYQSLRSAVDKSQTQKIAQIYENNPKLITNPKPNQNILTYVCLSGKASLVTLLLRLTMKNYSPETDLHINSSLIECIRFQRPDMVKLFVQEGFNLNNIVFCKKGLVMTSLDFAILGGHYQIAFYIYNLIDPQSKNMRNVKSYELLGKKHLYRYVNYQMFIDGLVNGVLPENIGNYLRKELTQERKEEIRRIHHEGCWEWLMRVLGVGKGKAEGKGVNGKGKTMVDSAESKYVNRGSGEPASDQKTSKAHGEPSQKLETSRPLTTQQSQP